MKRDQLDTPSVEPLRSAAEYAVAKSDKGMRCWGCSTMQVTPVGGPEYGPFPHDKACFIERLRSALATAATPTEPPKGHERIVHVGCEIPNCNICDGGLFVCKHCGKVEIELSGPCSPATQEQR